MVRKLIQIDYASQPNSSRFGTLIEFARGHVLTTTFIAIVVFVNLILAVLAIPGSVLVSGVLAPLINLLLGGLGIGMLPWVWSRSGEKVFALHAVLAVALPYSFNSIVGLVAVWAYPH